MNNDELKQQWLKSEQLQKKFIGWDFSHIENHYFQETTAWNYRNVVLNYLTPDMRLLDMGTGGGELLRTFNHPSDRTCVTEGWFKNYQLLLKTLFREGVNVQFVEENDYLNFPDNYFDIVINSHESFSTTEVKRVLKSGGLFISQQVGDLNGIHLASRLIPGFKKEKFALHLSSVLEELKLNRFKVLYKDESYPAQKFFNMEALIYYVRTIPWEFQNFSVENNFNNLLYLYDELQNKGYIYSQQHRFIFVAQSIKNE